MKHKTYLHKEARLEIYVRLIQKYGFERVISHVELLKKALDRRL